MNLPVPRVVPNVETLFAQFPPADDRPDYEIVAPDAVPAPYHKLLVHEHHMTVTVEDHHGSLVDVRVLDRTRHGESYSRKIVLALQSNGRIVQFGIMRIDLTACPSAARDRIVEEKTPLGRVLIEQNVLRRIELIALLRIRGGPAQMRWFGLTEPSTLYGRLAIIHCNGRPAVELLEIMAPE